MEKFLSLIIGGCCLAAGLIIYFMTVNSKSKGKNFNVTLMVGWLLIAIFPVFLIFYFYPASTAEGDIFNFKLGGAFAAFIFIWWFGTSRTITASKVDALSLENDKLKSDFDSIRNNPGLYTGKDYKPNVITTTERHIFSLNKSHSKKIGLITGTIGNIKDIDIWVNSENTNMQMARFYEGSISGLIRYMGAEKDKAKNVTKDIIAELLIKEVGNNLSVQPAAVFVTDAGDLTLSNKVKKIFHVASVQGVQGKGYKSVDNVEDCIKNALCTADEMKENFVSIVFPLLGTGTAKGDIEPAAKKLFDEAITYYELNPDTRLQEVYFIVYNDLQLKTCMDLLEKNPKLNKQD